MSLDRRTVGANAAAPRPASREEIHRPARILRRPEWDRLASPLPAARPRPGLWRQLGSSPLALASLGVLELTALPSLKQETWLPTVQAADVLLVNGGDPLYLCYWMRQSGLADLLPSLDIVYVGLSAGSMIMTPRIGQFFVEWTSPVGGGDETLGVVDFSIFPHLDHPELPYNTTANAEKWAAGIGVPAYAIDDETALMVTDGRVEVVSEGRWKQFAA